MTLLEEPLEVKTADPPSPPSGRWLIRTTAFFALATLLIFAHGCHGNEDTELFAPGRWVQWLVGH